MRPGYLEHNKSGPAAAVKISDKTKQEGYQQGVNGISPQIVCRRQDNFWVFGKGTGEDSPMEEGNVKQDQANPKRHGHTIGHPPFGPVHFPGTEILRHKGGHGLAEGIIKIKVHSFSATPTPAKAVTPRPLMTARITRKETLTKKS